jgi:hypothetical protein
VPKSVGEALRIDKEKGTNFWMKAVEKERKAIEHTFEFRDNNMMPVSYQKIDCHMIFNVKIMLDRKARYVAGGLQTEPTKDMTLASVVSRDSIRIAFLIATLNDLEVLSANVAGAYLNAKAKNVYTTASKEFGPDKEG